ncbi:phospholipid carrier-dependent glycosyltransferase [Patescibacteria group bacterium]|nr:phospholipid carrier-dependent glycosyltransferase [Patescibacteria group bacterium]MCL5091226.1 phospholipid carrier-dependent glycosyltransferase [Patescibacteria group bacterium]
MARLKLALALVAVLLVSSLVYFRHYNYPASLFWDENYFIASSYKYLHGVFFMEPHPPLGKLLIAAGEALWQPNRHLDTTGFLSTDYLKSVPAGFSFVGVRFFPALLATLSAGLFFLIIYIISNKVIFALLFSSLYLFDNALVVHSRGAMLDPIQIFFVLGALVQFFWMLKSARRHMRQFLVLGIWIGLAMSVKLNSAFLLALPLTLGWLELRQERHRRLQRFSQVVDKILVCFVVGTMVFVGTYYLHIRFARRVVGKNYYQASPAYRRVLDADQTGRLRNFPLMLRDQLRFIPHYEKGVPAYDACKSDENGSLPWTWPFGNKTINYRWESAGNTARYLYLVGNPVIWATGALAVFLSLVLVVSHWLFGLKIDDKPTFRTIVVVLFLYLIYMGSVVFLKRVMYLYHYFIPLLLSLIEAVLMFLYMTQQQIRKNPMLVYLILGIYVGIVLVTFLFFAPFTYYLPLTRTAFQWRNWFSWWHLQPI